MNQPAGAPAPSKRSQAIANMAWLLGDKALALLVGLGIYGLIARTLGPEGSGHFAYGAAMLQTGLGLSLVCAGAVLLPRFCRMQAALPGAMANVFVLRLLTSLLAMAVMMVFCVLAIADPQRRAVAMIMLAAVPLIEPFYVIATYWLSRNHNKPTVVARSSGLLTRAAIVMAGVWWGAPVWVLAAAWVLEAGVNAALQSLQMRQALGGRPLRRFVRPLRMRQYLRFGMRFVLALWLSQLFLRLDRLVLAEWMPAREFGLYAAPMQLVEVWSQVSYLVGSAIATAYLYQRLRQDTVVSAFLITTLAMVGIGLLGLLGAWLLGPMLLREVFGSAFEGSWGYLVSGAAFAVLLFADQVVDMLITARNRPQLLTLKWGVAVAVALLVFYLGFGRLGAFVGPLGLAAGIAAGWLVLLLRLSPQAWRGWRASPVAASGATL